MVELQRIEMYEVGFPYKDELKGVRYIKYELYECMAKAHG